MTPKQEAQAFSPGVFFCVFSCLPGLTGVATVSGEICFSAAGEAMCLNSDTKFTITKKRLDMQ
jgi:hypothetical protein